MTFSRREVLAALSAVPLLQAQTPPPSSSLDRPMRWAQIAFVEDDPTNYDPRFWFDYLKRIHCDGVCLSAGGCVAFYPTKIPLHYKSKFMGSTDPFGEMVKGCRDMGLQILARTDPHAVHQDVYDAHPDWIAVDAEGKKRRHWAMPELWVTCALGPYNFDFMTGVTREITENYKPDGIFSNRWAGSGMCYCEHCRENFHAFSGLDLPRTLDPANPARRQYIVWHQKRLFDLWTVWNDAIKAASPNAAFIANSGGGALSELDTQILGAREPFLAADRQARHGLMPIWSNGKNGKEYRSTMGNKPIAGLFSVGLEESYRWKDSVQSVNEIRMWVVDGIAQGLRPWFVKFNARVQDRRWMPVVEEIYTWHHANERYLRNEQNLARVAMVYSQQTAAYYGGTKAREKVEDPALGFYQALVEARVPFEMVHDGLLDQVSQYRTLILPNIAALSTRQCDQLRTFVQNGGSLIATYETSLYDEWGARQPDFGLADLFKANYDGHEGPMQNSYLNLAGPHPLLKGLEDTLRIINGVNRVTTKASPGAPLTLVPTYPDLPMEEVYARVPKTDIPGVFVNQIGKGRVIYFPWDIDRTFWEILDVDHGLLLRNAIHWATNEPAPVDVTGAGVLDISVWTQEQSMTVHLVNLTNPMMMKGPVREIIPIGAQRVRVRIPEGRHIATAHLLVSKKPIPLRRGTGFVECDVPGISLHEVIALE
jgi:Hypothetical glycosyl hydrolase 6/Beta-galactosidase trimerisation domain